MQLALKTVELALFRSGLSKQDRHGFTKAFNADRVIEWMVDYGRRLGQVIDEDSVRRQIADLETLRRRPVAEVDRELTAYAQAVERHNIRERERAESEGPRRPRRGETVATALTEEDARIR